jgi:hypothetical protein
MRGYRRARVFMLALWLLTALVRWLPTLPANAAPTEGFASSQMRAVWQRDDGPVASGQVSRTWMWGPGPFYTDYEPYADTPGGNHLVQYFDKGRLEINDPNGDTNSKWFVTSGLLVNEMVSGQAQTGDRSFNRLGPANVPVAGDTQATDTATYAHFASLMGRATNRAGQPLSGTSYLRINGSEAEVVGGLNTPTNVTLAKYEAASGHNWADVFWSFANSPSRPSGFDWVYTLGYPITEPYWIIVPVKGVRQTVLVQLFERRVLTFNPANPPATQVEMGNVGRHYYEWRYANLHRAGLGAKYQVQVEVGPAPVRSTSVKERVELTNSTGQPLSTVVLHAVWHHWDGVFTLQSASAQGAQASTRWVEGINLEVALPSAVPPGGKASVDLAFTVKPRPVGGRTGYDRSNDILSLGDMLPTVVPWVNGGWSYYPYSDLGDLGFYESSDYSVEIASSGSERLVVGGTGQIASVNQAGTSWHFEASNVRDIAYVVSPRFVNPLIDSSMTSRAGSTTILAYFLPGHRAEGQRQLELVTPALSWFSQKIGAYPFASYTVAEMGVPLERTDNYAQEYPMAYFVPTGWLELGTNPGSWTWYTPVHEVGHQWFYSTIGNNQLTDPWLDEAMTTYATTEYVRANYPNLYGTVYSSSTSGAATGRPVSSGVFSGFANENQYSRTVYDGGTAMLNGVRLAMGDDTFYAALRDYYQTFQFKVATPRDLMVKLQIHSKVDLQPIFSAYVNY